MRIISSTFNAIGGIFDAINSVSDLASDTAAKGLASLRNENLADQIIGEEDLSKRIEQKRIEIDKDFERIEKERNKLEQSEFYRKSQVRKLNSLIEIEEFRTQKELSSEEKIAKLREKLAKLQDKPATSVKEVKVIK